MWNWVGGLAWGAGVWQGALFLGMGRRFMAEPHFDKHANKGFVHLVNATRFSLQGLVSAFRYESAFRQEILMLFIVLPTGAWAAQNLWEFVALVCACLLVLVVELLNSGIEAAIDRVGTEYHDMARLAKDYGSAAVMLSLAIAALIWLTILLPQVLRLSGQT